MSWGGIRLFSSRLGANQLVLYEVSNHNHIL